MTEDKRDERENEQDVEDLDVTEQDADAVKGGTVPEGDDYWKWRK
jgi:hypothetical protein